ncbi:hypothetical protein [Salinibacter grassmerensis]|uniref:hypothetical protein n=1 Tax=Salinibacter grassmerensis TaxID=3040353 RepID=UPI0021E895DC|nr:hypothetical protein [Salinibacter grassmerensis]
MQAITEANTEATYTNDDGSWNRGAITQRAHKIASEMDEGRPHTDRLSIGMKKAWSEAKQERRDNQEQSIQEQRAGFGTRLAEWRETRREETTSSLPEAFPVDDRIEDATGMEGIERVFTDRWDLRPHRGTSGDRWCVSITSKLDDDASFAVEFSSATRVQAALDWLRRNADKYTARTRLIAAVVSAIQPDEHRHHTGEIARRQESNRGRHEDQQDLFICN